MSGHTCQVIMDNLQPLLINKENFLEKARKAITEGFATNSQGYSLSNSLSFVMFNFIKNALDNGKFNTQEQFTKIINEWTEM